MTPNLETLKQHSVWIPDRSKEQSSICYDQELTNRPQLQVFRLKLYSFLKRYGALPEVIYTSEEKPSDAYGCCYNEKGVL